MSRAESRELLQIAADAVEGLPDHRAMAYLNHLLEDRHSTSRVQHVLAFLAETALQIDEKDFSNAMTEDAVQGLGWILRSCHEALALHEELASRERQRDRMRAVE